ncbi:MAG: lipid A biosynthesis acyltransferase [Cyclobacteriaceae bacterium]|nr:lipid A biosynthesis acyltransferase [Cyclobacteriaceae bacterium]
MSWKGKTRGGLLGYKIFVLVLNQLGLKAAYFLLRLVSTYFVFFVPKASQAIYRYYKSIHYYSTFKAIRAVFTNYYIFGQTLLDKIAIMSGAVTDFSYDFDGEEHLHQLKAGGKGGMLISAHLGNWDIAGYLLKRIDVNINIVMFEAEHERIKNYLDNIVQNNNVNIIPIKGDMSHIILIKKAINNNEIICMHGDRFVKGSRVSKRKFMNNEAYFPTGVFSIAHKLKVPYTFVYCLKESPNSKHYKLSSTTIKNPSNSPLDILDDYVNSLEEKLKQFPNQWFNYFDFWSDEAEGAIIE